MDKHANERCHQDRPHRDRHAARLCVQLFANVVSSEEDVRVVLTKVALGEADAGIVYTSDVAASGGGEVGQIEIPDNLNTIASYPIAPLGDSPNLELAQQFVEYVLAAEGQQLLANYGFIPAAQ